MCFLCAVGFLQSGEDPVHSRPQPVAHRFAHQHHHHLPIQVNTRADAHHVVGSLPVRCHCLQWCLHRQTDM